MKKRNLLLVFAVFNMILTTFNFSTTAYAADVYSFDTQTLWGGSCGGRDTNNELSITILAEGYNENDHQNNLFIDEATRYVENLKTMSPYKEFADKINVHAVKIVSEMSGIPSSGDKVKTFFKTKIEPGGDLTSYWNSDSGLAPNMFSLKYFPETDFTVVLCNTGNKEAYSFFDKPGIINLRGGTASINKKDILPHELGHFLGLEDEYTGKDIGWNNDTTNDLTKVKWHCFLSYQGVGATNEPGVGSTKDHNADIYRPCSNCLMACSAGPSEKYCPVCSYQARRSLIANITNTFAGDLNNDNIIDTADYTLMRGYLIGTKSIPNEPNFILKADFNYDGYFDSADYSLLRKCLLNEEGYDFLINSDYFVRYHNGDKVIKPAK